MKTTTDKINVSDLQMSEKTCEVTFEVRLLTIPVWVSGTYFINTNAFYPSEVQGELLEEFCKNNDFDEAELTEALQDIFENR